MPNGTERQANKPRMSADKRETIAALGFLAPNFLGFLAFTSIPVIVSLVMAFTHWNIFKPPSWVGLENFASLLWFHEEEGGYVTNDPFFWQYVYNTVYLMIGIPFGMAASLIVALMMNQKLKGIVLFRTIYFLPTVCSGVALLILWKYLYNADIGLINKLLRQAGEVIYASKPMALGFTAIVAMLFGIVGVGLTAGTFSMVQWLSEKKWIVWACVAAVVILLGIVLPNLSLLARAALVIGGLVFAVLCAANSLLDSDASRTLFKVLTVIAGAAVFIAIGCYGRSFYGMVNSFFTIPPDWLGTVKWSKPSLILMGLWGALGGYNMILYLAALQGVPTSYYEAADIDGAGPWGKFWAVTWPMISPTTFFILIMSVIGGFQSGFMTADVMTGGGPAGSTTTIEYYLYQTAFQKFNMGYASAIAWFMFAVIFILTLVTWRLGGRVVTYD